MIEQDDDAMDEALANALDPSADDTSPLSRAVLSRLVEPAAPIRAPLADVLVQPLPAVGLLLGLLGVAALVGYLSGPGTPDDITTVVELLGLGF